MTDFYSTNFECQICGNINNNKEFNAREMLFGTKEEFKYIECTNCKCIQIKEIPEELGKYYPQTYNSFDKVIKMKDGILKSILKKRMTNDYLSDKLNVFSKFLVNKFGVGFLEKIKPTNVKTNSSILDIGSGNGLRLVGLARYGFTNILGTDPFIEQDISYENGIKILKKDIMEINGKFDMVMLNHAFEHMTNPKEVLQKINSLLEIGKIALIRIPVSNSFSWKKYGTNWVALDPPRHIFLHNENTIKILAKSSGFELTNVMYDSMEYQFVGSEQYQKDIPMFSNESYYRNKSNSIFTEEQINKYKEEAKRLNRIAEGDAACFYLTKIKDI
ncbi:MAG: class I SAM-dependent methyltransferase [Ignavibacteriales bacterium]|nr:class I SAM-dependent methyltransferase [Ignavibacteriales bacterium]